MWAGGGSAASSVGAAGCSGVSRCARLARQRRQRDVRRMLPRQRGPGGVDVRGCSVFVEPGLRREVLRPPPASSAANDSFRWRCCGGRACAGRCRRPGSSGAPRASAPRRSGASSRRRFPARSARGCGASRSLSCVRKSITASPIVVVVLQALRRCARAAAGRPTASGRRPAGTPAPWTCGSSPPAPGRGRIPGAAAPRRRCRASLRCACSQRSSASGAGVARRRPRAGIRPGAAGWSGAARRRAGPAAGGSRLRRCIQLAQHQADAALQPGVAIAGEARDAGPAAPPRRPTRACDGRGVQAHQLGGQRGAQQRLARRLQDGGQQRARARRRRGCRRRWPATARRCPRPAAPAHGASRALRVAAHQHRDVAGRQRPLAQRDLAAPRRRQQPRDLARAGLQRGLRRSLLRQRLASRRRAAGSTAAARRVPACCGRAAAGAAWRRSATRR